MKRFLSFFIVVLMTITLLACSSTKENPGSSTSPKVAESSTPPKANVPADSSKANEIKTPAEPSKAAETPADSPKVGQATAPVETPKAAEVKAPTESPKAAEQPKTPSESPKAAEQKAPVESPKATEPPAPTPAAAPQPEEVSAKGKKLLLVGRERAQEDVVVADRLKGLGFKVTMMLDRDFTADETKGYDLIYISQTLNSKIVKEGIMKNVAIPTVYVKNHGMFYLGLSSIEENANLLNVKSIDIVDSTHKVAGGLSGTVDVYKDTNSKMGISYGLPGKEAKVIATGPGDKSKATLYYYDKGTKADNGYEVKARVSFFYYFNGGMENVTEASWKLLDNLVLWTLQNG